MKKVRLEVLKYIYEYLDYISYFTDYDELQQFETEVMNSIEGYQNFLESEVFERIDCYTAVQKQVEIIENETPNRTGLLLNGSHIRGTCVEILQQIRAEENRNSIEELKLKSRQLITENEEVKSFQHELQELVYDPTTSCNKEKAIV